MGRIPRLHLISNRNLCPLDQFPDVARLAVNGGVEAVHVREPGLSADELRPTIRGLRQTLAGTNCRILVNFHAGLVAEEKLDGVHLPEEGSDPASTRVKIPERAILGVSVHSIEAAVAMEQAGADYLIAGNVYETGSKPGVPARGLEFLRDVVKSVKIPVIAIGGVKADNVRDVLECGAHGVAVISGILGSDDPEDAAAQYRNVLEQFQDTQT